MINVKLINHNYEYDIHQLLLVFFNEINFVKERSKNGIYLENILDVKSDEICIESFLYNDGKLVDKYIGSFNKESVIDKFPRNHYKRLIKHCLYKLISRHYPSKSQWGILTGMRPVKVVHKYLDAGFKVEDIESIFKNEYFVHEDKRRLIIDIAIKERPFIYPIDTKSIGVYLSIPFCITRCSYCSFPSNILSKKKELVRPYLEALKKELSAIKPYILKKGLTVDTLYIGGGTPSILEAAELEDLLIFLTTLFDMTEIKEFTFEAGRPKTITKEKLDLMKEYKVNRICLNPQTLNNEILKNINRDHMDEDIFEAYKLIESYNFKSINMDLILGLPMQNLETYRETLKKTRSLSPDNITIHSLAIKRGSKLNNIGYTFEDIQATQSLMDYSLKALSDTYDAYYMYRQKNIVGNLENIGFTKKGKESLYNIKIIEERHTILAFGAGAVSKIAYENSDRFERVPNSKGLEDYLSRNDEMIERKIEAINRIIR